MRSTHAGTGAGTGRRAITGVGRILTRGVDGRRAVCAGIACSTCTGMVNGLRGTVGAPSGLSRASTSRLVGGIARTRGGLICSAEGERLTRLRAGGCSLIRTSPCAGTDCRTLATVGSRVSALITASGRTRVTKARHMGPGSFVAGEATFRGDVLGLISVDALGTTVGRSRDMSNALCAGRDCRCCITTMRTKGRLLSTNAGRRITRTLGLVRRGCGKLAADSGTTLRRVVRTTGTLGTRSCARSSCGRLVSVITRTRGDTSSGCVSGVRRTVGGLIGMRTLGSGVRTTRGISGRLCARSSCRELRSTLGGTGGLLGSNDTGRMGTTARRLRGTHHTLMRGAAMSMKKGRGGTNRGAGRGNRTIRANSRKGLLPVILIVMTYVTVVAMIVVHEGEG